MHTQHSDSASTVRSASWFRRLGVETLTPFFLAALIGYAVVRSYRQALARPLWYDELCTWIVSHQPSLGAIWNSLAHGADGQPPGYYLVVRLANVLSANEHLASRLPSIVGFACVVFCVFSFIRRESGSINALLCAAIPLLTVLYDPFAVEARPYTVTVACLAIALIGYQRAPEIRWVILMGASLALAQSLHYYALFGFVPFVGAEAALLLRERQLRWSVWLALLCGLLPLAVFWPLLSRMRADYAEHFWAQPSLLVAEMTYGWLLNTTFAWGIGLVALTAIAVLGTMLAAERRAARGQFSAGPSLQVPLLALGLLSVPFIGFVATKLAHGGMTFRYALPTVLGFPLAAGYVLPRAGRKSVALLVAAVVIICLALAPQERRFWSSYSGRFQNPADLVEAFVALGDHTDLPVVVSDPHDFLQLTHYASPQWANRFVSVVDPPQAIIYSGSDTADRELWVLRSCAPLKVYAFQSFAEEHPLFLLYSSDGGRNLDWWPNRLLHDGYTLKPIVVKPRGSGDFLHRVFLVSRTEKPSPGTGSQPAPPDRNSR